MLSRFALRPLLRLLLAALITGLFPSNARPLLLSTPLPSAQFGPVGQSTVQAQPQMAPLSSVPQPDVTPRSRTAHAPVKQLPSMLTPAQVLWPTTGSSPGGVYLYSAAT